MLILAYRKIYLFFLFSSPRRACANIIQMNPWSFILTGHPYRFVINPPNIRRQESSFFFFIHGDLVEGQV